MRENRTHGSRWRTLETDACDHGGVKPDAGRETNRHVRCPPIADPMRTAPASDPSWDVGRCVDPVGSTGGIMSRSGSPGVRVLSDVAFGGLDAGMPNRRRLPRGQGDIAQHLVRMVHQLRDARVASHNPAVNPTASASSATSPSPDWPAIPRP